MKNLIIIVTFFILVGLQNNAVANEGTASHEAMFNPPNSGTIVKWEGKKNGKYFKVEHHIGKSKGLLARWKSNGKNYERYGLISFGTPDTFDTSKVDPLWPLKVGNEVSYKRSKGNRSWNDSIKVVGTETINTRIGEFKTYVLQVDTENQNKKWSAKFKAWYAPKLGWAIKREYKDSEGNVAISEVVEVITP
jgi:hypothetical protein